MVCDVGSRTLSNLPCEYCSACHVVDRRWASSVNLAHRKLGTCRLQKLDRCAFVCPALASCFGEFDSSCRPALLLLALWKKSSIYCLLRKRFALQTIEYGTSNQTPFGLMVDGGQPEWWRPAIETSLGDPWLLQETFRDFVVHISELHSDTRQENTRDISRKESPARWNESSDTDCIHNLKIAQK